MARPALRSLLASALLLACSAPAPEHAGPGSVVRGMPWPHESSDLTPDPALKFARLPNGLRFVWQQHAHPPGRCSLRLVVHVGSVDEGDGERGMAHFVEHMAFNGTRRFPGNSVLEWFRQRGMTGGAHVSAFTSSIDTTYGVDLPANDLASVQDGLAVLCDITTGMLFEPAEVEAERGVIDAEEREIYSSPLARAASESRRRLLAGCREVEHDPIGTATDRAAFTVESMRAFHARWYRPDNMTLIAVGDVAKLDVPGLVATSFGTLPAVASPRPPRGDRGAPTLRDVNFVVEQPGRADVEFHVFCAPAAVDARRTRASMRQRALMLVTGELTEWMLAPPTKETGAVIDLAVRSPLSLGFDEFQGIVLHFRCPHQQAENAIRTVAAAVADLRSRGFTAELLDRVRKKSVPEFEASARMAQSVDQARLSNDLALHLAADAVTVAAVHEIAIQAWCDADAAACSSLFRAAWQCDAPAIVGVAGAPLGFDPLAAWRQGLGEPPPPMPAWDALPWPYATLDTPTATEPVGRVHHGGLDVHEVSFASGVRLLVKRTELAADQIVVGVCVGYGSTALPDDLRAAGTAFEWAWQESGLGQLPASSLYEVSARHRAGVELWRHVRCVGLRGVTDQESLAFQLEWLRAHCEDPGWSDDALDRAKAKYVPRIRQYQQTSTGELHGFLARLMRRPLMSPAEDLDAVRLAGVQRFFDATWRRAPLTVIVLGDVDIESTVAAVARTFGVLPQRNAFAPFPGYATSGPPRHEEVDLRAGETSSAIVVLAPLTTADVMLDGAALGLLSGVLLERLRGRVREQLGATYAPRAGPAAYATTPPTVLLQVEMRIAPGDERRVLDAVLAEIATLRTTGVTPAELDAARRVAHNQIDEERATNDGWLRELSRAHDEPGELQRLAERHSRVDTVTSADLQRVAARCLSPESVSTLVMRAKVR